MMKPTKFDFLEACYRLPELKEKVKEDPSARNLEALGATVAVIQCFLFNIEITEYPALYDWIALYFEVGKQIGEVEGLERQYMLPSVKPPEFFND